MLEALVFSYGLLASFVMAGVERNHRERRSHSRVLTYAGYVLCGTLTGLALALTGWLVGTATGIL